MKRIGIVFTVVALTLLAIGARTAAAQESILYSFGGVGSDPEEPNAGLILDAKGNLYGTSQWGGPTAEGAVFELSPVKGGWTETVLWSFNQGAEGSNPVGSLTLDKDGNLYGTLSFGGPNNANGEVFELSPGGADGAWTEKTLWSFGITASDGIQPQANLILDGDGNLYGTTQSGGLGNWGTVFELSPPGTGGEWTEKVLHNFDSGPYAGNDGQHPRGGLIFDAEGNLYGTTPGGGANGGNGGTVFELLKAGDWTEKVLYSFQENNVDATHPAAGLIFDGQGNLFGTGSQGGTTGNYGAVFELSPGTGGAWTEKVLWNFTGGPSDGASPYSTLVLDAQGNLYGTSDFGGADGYAFNGGNPAYGGTVFELSPAAGGAWTETILHNFGAPSTDGLFPYDGLVADADGNFYGTTYQGGAYDASQYTSWGTVFELAAAGLPSFTPGPGVYVGTQTVTITSKTKGATIYYTLDGKTPTTASTKYTGPVAVSASETINAFATAAGYPNSAVASAAYTILVQPEVGLTLSSGNITTEQALSVKAAVAATGGRPTPTGTVKLSSGTYSSAEIELSGGSATFAIPADTLPAGSDALTATYYPDSASSLVYASSKGSAPVTVTRITPAVELTLSASSITAAQSLTATIAVGAATGDPVPTGTVTLTSGKYTSVATALAGGSATITVPAGSLPAGSDSLTATYAGSAIYNAASGTASVTVVSQIATKVQVIPAAATVLRVDPLAVSVAVTAASGTPTGSVILSGPGYTSAATALTAAKASFTIPADTLTAGYDKLTATYTPTGNFASSTGAVAVSVNKEAPTVTVTPAQTSVARVASLSVKIVVAAATGTPTGTVILSSAGYSSAATALSGGAATIIIPADKLTVGAQSLTAAYSGDANDSASAAKASVTVIKLTPTVIASPTLASIARTSPLSVAIKVAATAGVPTGAVTLSGGGYTSAATALSTGYATIVIPADKLTVAADELTVTYSGDANDNSATTSLKATVGKLTPTVTVTPATTKTSIASALPVAIKVASSATTLPTGTVTLSGGGYTSAATSLSAGAATIVIPAEKLAVAADKLTVTYSGDVNFNTSAGASTVTVSKLTPTVTVTPASTTPVDTNSLSVSVKVTAAAGTPTGTVTLVAGSYTSAVTTLASGTATIVIPAGKLVAGKDTLTVSYSGDGNDSAATGSASVTVSQ